MIRTFEADLAKRLYGIYPKASKAQTQAAAKKVAKAALSAAKDVEKSLDKARNVELKAAADEFELAAAVGAFESHLSAGPPVDEYSYKFQFTFDQDLDSGDLQAFKGAVYEALGAQQGRFRGREKMVVDSFLTYDPYR